jgi:hypothetical protein
LPTPETPRNPARGLRLALVIVGVTLAVAVLLLYAARRTIAREALTAWLKSKGVPATAQIQAVGPTGVTGSIVIGDPRRPDLTIERAEIGYGLVGFEIRSVRLVRPVLRARLHGGQLSAGALDPLIAEFRKAPPRPNAAQPRITVERGIVLLATEYGPLRIDADARLSDGRLEQLSARTAAGRLRGKGFDARLGPAALTAKAVADRVELTLEAPIVEAEAAGVAASNAHLRIKAAGPYPDFKARRGDGAVVAHAEITGGRISAGGQAVRNGFVSAALTGEARGWLDTLAVTGRVVVNLRAGGFEAADGKGGAVQASGVAEDLRWTRKGGDAVSARISATASVDSYAREALKVSTATASVRGPVAFDRDGVDLDLAASALGRGAWTGLGPPVALDSAEIAAVKRAAQAFRFAAPALAVQGRDGRIAACILQPVRLLPDRGGAATLSPAGAGWKLAVAGGGLPKVDADIRRFAIGAEGATATARVKAALSIGPIQQGVFDAAGALRIGAAGVSFTGERCVQATAAKMEFGENDVEKVSGRFCPTGRPLLTMSDGDWRITGRAEGVSAAVPLLQARVAAGAGVMDLVSRKAVLSAQAQVTAAEAFDTAPSTRFRPVGVTGEARLAQGLWTSSLVIRDPAGRRLATAALRHAESGQGGVQIETGRLHFTPGGLQPAELSPLAAAIASPAEGEAVFSGAFHWSPKAITSHGVLEVPRLDFVSPAGALKGLTGRIEFTSLAPLTAAPGQTLRADSIQTALGPVTDLALAFGLEPELVRVSGGQAAVGGGLVKIAELEFPFAAGKPIRGVLQLEGVQLHDLIEASPFGDKVELDAKVSGRIPFTAEGAKVRIHGGKLDAVQPGRLSIQRSAITGVEATGEVQASGAPGVEAAAPAPGTDTFSDFAYQAMENLAFSTLSATVDSRPDGRLAVLFHIIGKHDPPQHQEIRLTWLDLIQRKFLNRKLPLPSDTGVDLTLDTTLNLDDLLADYVEFRRLHGSAEVQPK